MGSRFCNVSSLQTILSASRCFTFLILTPLPFENRALRAEDSREIP